jgi:DNA-binding LacI/PurR family transcriptional regulator
MKSPKYAVAQTGIINLIATRNMQPGDLLPTEKELSKHFNVSVITIRRAMENLEEMQVVRREQGRGTFLTAEISERVNSGTIVFLNVMLKEDVFMVVNPSFEILNTSLNERGYNLKALAVGQKPSASTIEALQEVNGVIATGWINKQWIQVLNSMNLPIVFAGDVIEGPKDIPAAVYDWRRMTVMLANQLFECGARNIGMIIGGRDYGPTIQMREGFRYVLNRHNAKFDPNAIFYSADDVVDKMPSFLDDNRHQDAFLVEDGCYIHVLNYLLNKSWRPKIALMGVSPNRGFINENVIGAAFHGDIMARSVELLFEVIQSTGKPVKSIKLKPYLM